MLLAPTSADVTRGSRSVHATAICASVWPRRRAISVSARTLPSVSSLIMSVVMKTPRLARDPAGTPLLISQPSYSMFNRWIENGLLDALADVGAGCIVFSALAQGLLTDRYLHGVPAGSPCR